MGFTRVRKHNIAVCWSYLFYSKAASGAHLTKKQRNKAKVTFPGRGLSFPCSFVLVSCGEEEEKNKSFRTKVIARECHIASVTSDKRNKTEPWLSLAKKKWRQEPFDPFRGVQCRNDTSHHRKHNAPHCRWSRHPVTEVKEGRQGNKASSLYKFAAIAWNNAVHMPEQVWHCKFTSHDAWEEDKEG